MTVNGANGGANKDAIRIMLPGAWKAGGNKNTFNVDDVGYATAAAAGLTAGDLCHLLVHLLEQNKGLVL